jgi:hypothetical protein
MWMKGNYTAEVDPDPGLPVPEETEKKQSTWVWSGRSFSPQILAFSVRFENSEISDRLSHKKVTH